MSASPYGRIAATGVLVVALAATTACSSDAGSSGEDSVLRFGLNETEYADTRSPLDGGNLNYAYGRAAYESLIILDPSTYEYEPLLAESWELSEDRLTLDFQLRDDVDFTDGEHLDAQAVADFFDIAMQSDGFGAKSDFQDRYEVTFEVVDEYTLRFVTTRPMDDVFFFKIRTIGIASPVAAADREALAENPVGTGPYLLDDQVVDVSMSWVRNPDYWNPEAFAYDRLEYLVFADQVAMGNALRGDQIDTFDLRDMTLFPGLESDGFTAAEGSGRYATLLVTDFTGETIPALGDVRVRRAIAMALDQQAIIDSVEGGYGTVGDQPFGKGQATYVPGEEDTYPYDLDAARELMADAGYADGFDLVIPAASSVAFIPVIYEPAIQQSLADIGIRVEFNRVADVGAIIGEFANRANPVLYFGAAYEDTLAVIQGDPAFMGHFEEDPTFLELVTILNEGTASESEGAALELGQYLLDQVWFIPIAQRPLMRVLAPDVVYPAGTVSDSTRLDWFRPAS